MSSDPVITIDHLQSRLLRLMEEVQTQRVERPALRAEVLLAMNQLCSAELLLGLWHTLEKTGAREELMLVQLVRTLDPKRLDQACAALLDRSDEHARSVGYAVVALRARQAGARLIAERFVHEPGLVLKRGGRRHLAPYSFITCMLAGMREFKNPVLDQLAIKALRAFGQGRDDLELIAELIADRRTEVRKLGFVTLASRFMGRVHRHAYREVVCGDAAPPPEPELQWMRRALRLAPEVIEAIAEPGPAGVDDADFVRARAHLLRQLGDDLFVELVHKLLSEQPELPSAQLGARPTRTTPRRVSHQQRARAIAYLAAVLVGNRHGLAELVEGLAAHRALETRVMDQIVELSGPRGALNLATALICHWDQADQAAPGEGPLWRWIDGFWRDDRHVNTAEAVDVALERPDETALFAARILATIGDPRGALLAAIRAGQPVDLAELHKQLADPRAQPALRATLRDPDVHPHPQTILSLARAGLSELQRPLSARVPDATGLEDLDALARAAQLLAAEKTARHHGLYRELLALGLRPLDRELVLGEAAAIAAPSGHPLHQHLNGASDRVLLVVHFWLHDAQLPASVGARPATGYAARAHFVVELPTRRVLGAAWSDRDGRTHTHLALPQPPPEYQHGFADVPWGTSVEQLYAAVDAAGGQLLNTVPFAPGRRATRSLAILNGTAARLETDEDGRFVQALVPLAFKRLVSAANAAAARFGDPMFRTGSVAVWRFLGLEVGIKPDPAFDTLAEYVRSVPQP